jgi:hypothetical protein
MPIQQPFKRENAEGRFIPAFCYLRGKLSKSPLMAAAQLPIE